LPLFFVAVKKDTRQSSLKGEAALLHKHDAVTLPEFINKSKHGHKGSLFTS
jgi:hypothetical protein